MTYGCQQFPITRLCRYDRRAIDRKCDGCQRTTDSEYLKSMGLWIEGISHEREFECDFLTWNEFEEMVTK